jgi:hypothetical protein
MTKLSKIMVYVILVVLAANSVMALGVMPAKKIVEFAPGSHEITLRIINNEHKNFKAVVYARGDIAQYTNLQNTLITVEAEEATKEFTFTLNLPEKMEKPGTHEADIVIMEFPKEFASEQETTVITATASIVAKLQVRVPYPGKYAESDIIISGAQVGENVVFTLPIYNFGKEDIQKVKATIRIVGATYEEIAVVETNEISVPAGGQSKIVAKWPANVNAGVYHVIATVNYDGKQIRLDKNFNVGNLFVDITRIDVQDFSLGDIAKFEIYLQSKWNQPISNVYGEMTVTDKQGTQYTKFKTAAIDLEPQGIGKLFAYWDTKGVSVGLYDLRLVLHYAGQTTEKIIETQVNIDSIRTSITPVAEVIAQKGAIGRDAILIVVVAILIIINIAWFVYFRKTRKI